MNLVEYPDREMLAIDVGNRLAGELTERLMNHDHASFAVPGGTTPGPVFDMLCAADLDWSRVHVLPTDERWVPETHERSNAGLIRRRLLVDRAAAASLVPLYAPDGTPEDSLDALTDGLRPELPVSVLLLGMGGDMHTASLFPGAEGLEAAMDDDAPPLMAMRPEGQPEARITLTAPVLRDALSCHVVITGADKRKAVEEAWRIADPVRAPIFAVLHDATVHWAE